MENYLDINLSQIFQNASFLQKYLKKMKKGKFQYQNGVFGIPPTLYGRISFCSIEEL